MALNTDGRFIDMGPEDIPSNNLEEFDSVSDNDEENHENEVTTILLPPPELTDSFTDANNGIVNQVVLPYNDQDNGGAGSNLKPNLRKTVNVQVAASETNPTQYEEILVPPDGGWGWMVLFGSIIVNILIPGTVKSFGILFIEFIEAFKASPAEASWIPALSYWLYSSVGPFASALAIKYSHRAVTIAGGLLASAGLMLSYFATSIPFLYVSYGIIGGFGAGLSYPIGVLVVGQYFENRRGLANGLCTSGSALGSVLVPPLLHHLLEKYGYREAILIMGGMLLNVCVGAMFFEPVEKHMKKVLVLKAQDEKLSEFVVYTASSASETITSPRMMSRKPKQTHNHIGIIKSSMGNSEMASSMPITIPVQSHSQEIRGDLDSDRRGSGNVRRATFQIGHETPLASSWSLRSMEGRSLMTQFHEDAQGYSPNISASQTLRIKSQSQLGTGSAKDLDVMVDGDITAPLVIGTNTPSLGAATESSRCASRANLTAIPEDEDSGSETHSKYGDWQYYDGMPAVKQRLIRMSVSSGNQLHLPIQTPTQGNSTIGLSRTMSVASNVSSSSFHYVSTHHHGGMLAAMQLDKHLPQFASSLTIRSVRKSCCAKVTDFFRRSWRGKSEQEEAEITTAVDNRADIADDFVATEKGETTISKFIDLSLLKDGMYLVMLLSNSTTAIGYTNFLIILPAYAVSLGYDKTDASYLLSVVAAFDFIGRIGAAALSDSKCIRRKWYYIVGLFFSGLALTLLPMSESYAVLAAFCGFFGLASGTYVGVTAVLLADELGIERLGSSYGISLFVNGALQLAGPPVCGAIVVWQSSYNKLISGLGIVLILGSLFWIATPFIERRRRKTIVEAEIPLAQVNEGDGKAGNCHPKDRSSL